MTPRRHFHDLFPNELCLVGAASEAALARELQSLLHLFEHTPSLALRDVAYALAQAARGAPVILAAVATDLPDLTARLRLAHAKLTTGAARIRDKSGLFYFRERMRPAGRLVFLFPGETSHYPEMLRDLCLSFDCCRAAFDEADAACPTEGGFHPGDWVFGGTGEHTSASAAPGMAGALLCTHAANTALMRLFDALGVRPDAVLGHSSGEMSALEYAGVFGSLSGAERLRFLHETYHLCTDLAARADLPASILLAVEDPPADFLATLGAPHHSNRVIPILFNGPRQVVLATPPELADETLDALRRQGAKATRLDARRAYHNPAFAPGLEVIRGALSRWARHAPRLPVYSCLDAAPLPASLPALIDTCTRQWAAPVRFSETVERLHADGFRLFVELGARGTLATRVDEILDGCPHVAIAVNRVHRPGLTQLHQALALLAAHGIAFDATVLHQHRASRLIDLRRPSPAPARRSPRAEAAVLLDAALPEIASWESLTPLTQADDARKPAPAGMPSSLRRADFGADFPLLARAEVLDEKPGTRIELRKTFTTEDYPLIRDYALAAHHVSIGQPSLGGLPMLSAVTCIEIMAEAARRLFPQKRVVQVDDLRGKRIVTLERGDARLVIRAERIEWPEPGCMAVRVSLRTPTTDSLFSLPMAEATVFLASMPLERETAKPQPLHNPRPVNWTGSELYPNRLFQGPLLRAVSHVFLWGEDGLDYELVVPPRAGAVRDTRIPLFSVWPQLMDGVSAGISLWRSQEPFNGVLTLPFRARSIRLLATVLPEGTRLRAYLRITARSPRSYVADVLVSDGRGHLVLTASGWEELVCPVTPPIHRLMLQPSETYLTRELPPALLGDTSIPVRGAIASPPPRGLFDSQQELWLRAVAFALLNPAERDEWLAMRGLAGRRIEWLLGRACVKDAVRRYLQDQEQQTWAAADVPIWTDDSGKPHAHGPWQERTRAPIDISIAHTNGLVAAAIAVNGRIGIDLERLGRDMSDDFTRSVFTAEENDLAAGSGDAPAALLRFWCAKEALAKALGTGIRYNPNDLRVRSVDALTGRMELELAGQWLDAFEMLRGRAMPVHTARLDNHVLATCVIPAALLPLP